MGLVSCQDHLLVADSMFNLAEPLQVHAHRRPSLIANAPGCSLDCYSLSMHLPALNERNSCLVRSYAPGDMQDDPRSQELCHLSGGSQNLPSHYTPLPPSYEAFVSVSPIKDTRPSRRNTVGDLSVTSSTEHSGTSNHRGSATTSGSSVWPDDLLRTKDDSAESQLTSGPPGVARRAKAHVPSACVNCKKKHLACETKRPCGRCVQNGKEASCIDVQHKKRGRPRLREEDGSRHGKRRESYVETTKATVPVLVADPSAHHIRHKSKTYREIRSFPESISQNGDQAQKSINTFAPMSVFPSGEAFSFTNEIKSTISTQVGIPAVILTTDFKIAQHNSAFSDALCLPFTARGQSLQELVVASERDKIRRLHAIMVHEHASAMRRATARGEQDLLSTMPPIDQLDIPRATHGFQTRSEYWTFRLPRDTSRGFPVSISLAKDRGLFIILTLVPTPQRIPSISAGPKYSYTPAAVDVPDLNSFQSTNTLYYDTQPHPRMLSHRRNQSSGHEMPYLAHLMPSSLADSYHGQMHVPRYRPASPPRSVQMPYSTTSYSTSSRSHSNSLTGSEVPRSDTASGAYPSPAASRDGLKHLQLPPIRSSPTKGSSSPVEPTYHRRRHQTQTPSPARGSPHSSKRKKRRRLEIGDMLH